MCLRESNKKKYEIFFLFASLKSMMKGTDPELDPDPYPDPLLRGTDPIQIRTKMSRIPNTLCV